VFRGVIDPFPEVVEDRSFRDVSLSASSPSNSAPIACINAG
jgi:hypothetical protein